jgi:hypothetical protein
MVFQTMQSVPSEELIDFEEQLELFKKMLADPVEKCLMFVQAPGTCGKTSLLRLMRLHCKEQGAPCCWIDFRGQSYDNPHFTLAHEMCDQLGLSPRHLAEALQPLSTYRPVGAEATTHIGGDVTDSYVITQILTGVSSTHEDLRQRYMKDRLKRAFASDLGGFAAKQEGMVCFFDSFEDISAEEEDWLLEALLCPVAKGELKGVTIVTAGRRWPKIERWEWEDCAHLIDGLPPMSVEHVKIYAQKVQVEITHEQAEFCWRACRGGNPLFMGVVVKNLRAMGEVRR